MMNLTSPLQHAQQLFQNGISANDIIDELHNDFDLDTTTAIAAVATVVLLAAQAATNTEATMVRPYLAGIHPPLTGLGAHSGDPNRGARSECRTANDNRSPRKGDGLANVNTDRSDLYGSLSLNALELIARSRNIDIPHGAQRDQIVELLRTYDKKPPAQPEKKSRQTASRRPSGWWTTRSVAELRDITREHGIAVPAGIRRNELIQLLIEHDVPRPPRQS